MKKCEGVCCADALLTLPPRIVQRVRVVGSKGYDWGEFWYCPEAIAEDERRGFTVTPIDESVDEAVT